MNALIGRHGHGGGGRGHGGHGGRRFFGGGGGWGGYWGGWPLEYTYPSYWQQPPYSYFDVESSETESVGATVAALSPGADGLSCEMCLGPDMRLHVAILVDGRRHETSVDLSGLLCDIAERASRAHPARGASQEAADVAVQDVTTKTARAVHSAGTLLVGALYDKHLQEVTAGFWDSLKGAYRTVSTPVTWFHKKVAQTIQKVPGLKQAVTVAATAVATAYGGPAAGAAASRLVGPIIDSSAETGGDPTMLFEKTKKDAHRHSGGDPKVAQAITHAQSAITQTAAAYTLKEMAQNAGAGDPDAARQIGEIQRSAQAGDPAAARAMQLLAEIQRSSEAPPDSSTSDPSTAVGFSGIFPDEMRNLALASAAHTRATHGFGEAVVFVFSPQHGQFSVPFGTRSEALRYMRRVDPRSIAYIASVDVSDPDSPFLLSERSFHHPGVVASRSGRGGASDASETMTSSSGAFLPFLLGAGAGALGGALWSSMDWRRQLLDGARKGHGVYWQNQGQNQRIYVADPEFGRASMPTRG